MEAHTLSLSKSQEPPLGSGTRNHSAWEKGKIQYSSFNACAANLSPGTGLHREPTIPELAQASLTPPLTVRIQVSWHFLSSPLFNLVWCDKYVSYKIRGSEQTLRGSSSKIFPVSDTDIWRVVSPWDRNSDLPQITWATDTEGHFEYHLDQA